ncbi:dienelactone hydrolase family protein [Sphingomonas sp.]|uniref:dienelactone hydrolase family protein n=1 Tax=Sphingomonas sp. TaxID=28214 RepID=UPI003B3BB683
MSVRPVGYRDEEVALVGELHRPETHNGAAVLVVHEADGLGGNVRRRCALLAERGYVAFAADLHGGGQTLYGEEMSSAVAAFLADPERLRRRTAVALDTCMELAGTDADRTVAIGYCFGGTAVLELARSGRELAAVASYHGLLATRRPAERGAIRARIAAFTGGKDPLVPPHDVAAFQEEMAAAEADWQLSVYGQAWHSFTNIGVQDSSDPRMRYDPMADRLSWDAGLAFLDAAIGATRG